MRFRSIRARMTLAFTVCIALLMLLACQLLAWYARNAAEGNAHTILEAMARKVSDDLTDDEHRVPLRDLPEEEREILRPDGIALFVVNARGQVILQSQPDIPRWPHPSHTEWRLEGIPFGEHRILLALPWAKTERALRQQSLLLALLGLFVTAVASIGAWLLVGRTLSPIGALSRQAQTVSVESLHLRLEPPSDDAELVELVATLNGLLNRIEETVAAKGRFHAAASHELRTPLQALSGQLELALSRERTDTEYRDFITEANAYAQRLISLARDLLLLHQLDGSPLPVKTQVNLDDICARMLTLFHARIQEQRLQIQTDLSEDAVIEAPPTHAEMLVRNLLENAVKYTPEGGNICVRLSVCSRGTVLDIVNDGSLPADRDTKSLFEPFYRPDKARHHLTGGTGLGLAICKAITEANGWELQLLSEGQSVRASVVFT